MHAVIGRVKIKPGRADETLAMIGEGGVPAARRRWITGGSRHVATPGPVTALRC
jgi:hypothetical protein